MCVTFLHSNMEIENLCFSETSLYCDLSNLQLKSNLYGPMSLYVTVNVVFMEGGEFTGWGQGGIMCAIIQTEKWKIKSSCFFLPLKLVLLFLQLCV